MPIFRSLFLNQVNGKKEYIYKYLSNNFYEKYRHFELKPNQYLLRVGKHSGARAVTIDGMRDIKSKISGGGKRRKPNKFEYREDETTTWLFGDKSNSNYGLLPFGWVLAEITNEEIPKYEAIDGLYALQVKRAKEKIENRLAREEAQKREAQAKAKKEAEEKAKLASMTPVQRLVDSYSDMAVLINDMRAGKIEDFESIKVELAGEVKKILQQKPKTWDKAKKKALDRRVYIEGLFT
jgi:CRISPR-associated protein Csm5